MQTIASDSQSDADANARPHRLEDVVVALMSDAYRTALRLVRRADGIFDVLRDDDGRQAHLAGRIGHTRVEAADRVIVRRNK